MPGPGECRADPSHRRIEDLPKHKIAARPEEYHHQPCPRCGQERLSRSAGATHPPRPGRSPDRWAPRTDCDPSQQYCTRCRRSWDDNMRTWLHPVDQYCQDALSTRPFAWSSRTAYRIAPPVGACGAITASSFLTPRSRTGSRRGGNGRAANSHRLLDWALSDFSGYLAADELYDGPFCVLSIVDNRTFKRLSYHVLDRDPTQVDVEAFFRRFRQALEARGLTVQGITTDGSTLYPEPIAAAFGAVPHQVCQFHILHEVNKAVLSAVAQERKRLVAGAPKLPRGRPSSKEAKRAARRKKRIEQKVGELFRTATCSSSGG